MNLFQSLPKKTLFLRLSALSLCLGLLVACGGAPKPKPEVFLKVVNIKVDTNANQNSAVAMDLVIIYNKDLIGHILALSASKYFKQKEQLMRDYPGELHAQEWEIIPGQLVPRTLIHMKPLPMGAIFFANYGTPGDHRIRLGKEKSVLITLARDNFSLAEVALHPSQNGSDD